MKGFLKIETTDHGTTAHTELREVSPMDKGEILALVFRSLRMKGAQEIAMYAALAGAANEANAFSGMEIDLSAATKAAEQPEATGEDEG